MYNFDESEITSKNITPPQSDYFLRNVKKTKHGTTTKYKIQIKDQSIIHQQPKSRSTVPHY